MGSFQASRMVYDAEASGVFEVEKYGSTMPAYSDGVGEILLTFNLNRSSPLYQNGLTEVRVNALYSLNLIRAF